MKHDFAGWISDLRPRDFRSYGLGICVIVVLGSALFFGSKPLSAQETASPIKYNEHIRPILSNKCFECHGNDANSRQADLRLDRFENATAEAGSGETPIVPGDPEASELIYRITSENDSDRMPPAESHKTRLTESEIRLLQTWIKQGAEYQPHWALIPPTKVGLGHLPTDAWCRNEIDRFVLRRAREQGLEVSTEAERRTLIRRVTLDLTGLPPSPDEVTAFLNDASPEAYETLVDRLLASPAYGEQMARFWLDAARYGDTHGLHLDNYREMWPYRDWVIRAFNDNMHWDDFTIRQLAGDLLPDATDDDRIASGFNRLHVTTNEGGAIPEEVFVRNVVDRVSTTGTVFMGMTFGCAVCHDHKYDPISQEDFYSLYGFFNSLDDNPMDGNAKAHAPIISVMTEEDRVRMEIIDQELAEIRNQLQNPDNVDREAINNWQDVLTRSLVDGWQPASASHATAMEGATLSIKGEDSNIVEASGANPAKETYEVTLHGRTASARMLRLEVLPPEGQEQLGGGRSKNRNAVLSEVRAFIKAKEDDDAAYRPFSIAAATADFSQPSYHVSTVIDGVVDDRNGWGIEGHINPKPHSMLLLFNEAFDATASDLKIVLEFKTQFEQHTFERMRFSFAPSPPIHQTTFSPWSMAGPFIEMDRERAFATDFGPESASFDPQATFARPSAPETERVSWTDVPGLRDGAVHEFSQEAGARYLFRRVVPNTNTLSLSLGSDDALVVWVNGEKQFENNVARPVAANQDQITINVKAGEPNDLLFKVVNFGGGCGFYFSAQLDEANEFALYPILAKASGELSDDDQKLLDRTYLSQFSPLYLKLIESETKLEKEKQAIESTLPTTLVSRELEMPRPAYVLKRGEYDKPDKDRGEMERRVPAFLPPMPESLPRNRMGLAQWLVSADNPMLPRVTVNRFWMQCLGSGIVKTPDDFGVQGSWPTHPELLDYLAVDFVEHDWDVKRLMKQIVMSATYRQQSSAAPERWKADPTNRWLTRGPRYRLDAEMLRDQALAVSGLLVDKIGGPGVRPLQPPGIWEAVGYVGSNTQTFTPDMGHEKVHRRSIYTFWKRTAPPPQMATFDSPTREECVIQRERTNTPLQALLLLNDPQYVECAKALAARVMTSGQTEAGDSGTIVGLMLELATGRTAESREIEALTSFFEDRKAFYAVNEMARKELLMVGEPLESAELLDQTELAAWTAVANVVLNLDEVITKH